MVVMGYLLSTGLDVCNCKGFPKSNQEFRKMTSELTLVFCSKWDLKIFHLHPNYHYWDTEQIYSTFSVIFLCDRNGLHRSTLEMLFGNWATRLHHSCPAAHDSDRMTEQAWKQAGGYHEKLPWKVRKVTKVDFIPNKGQTATYSCLFAHRHSVFFYLVHTLFALAT